MAAASAGAPLMPWTFDRRDVRPDDIAVRVTYCGVCHTDVHAWHGDPLYGNNFPLVPGHEFVGIVTEVGNSVTQFARGDYVAVGNVVAPAASATGASTAASSIATSGRR